MVEYSILCPQLHSIGGHILHIFGHFFVNISVDMTTCTIVPIGGCQTDILLTIMAIPENQ